MNNIESKINELQEEQTKILNLVLMKKVNINLIINYGKRLEKNKNEIKYLKSMI